MAEKFLTEQDQNSSEKDHWWEELQRKISDRQHKDEAKIHNHNRSFADKLLKRNMISPIDVAHEEAIEDDEVFKDEERKEEERRDQQALLAKEIDVLLASIKELEKVVPLDVDIIKAKETELAEKFEVYNDLFPLR